jgi:hypothetical protein
VNETRIPGLLARGGRTVGVTCVSGGCQPAQHEPPSAGAAHGPSATNGCHAHALPDWNDRPSQPQNVGADGGHGSGLHAPSWPHPGVVNWHCCPDGQSALVRHPADASGRGARHPARVYAASQLAASG